MSSAFRGNASRFSQPLHSIATDKKILLVCVSCWQFHETTQKHRDLQTLKAFHTSPGSSLFLPAPAHVNLPCYTPINSYYPVMPSDPALSGLQPNLGRANSSRDEWAQSPAGTANPWNRAFRLNNSPLLSPSSSPWKGKGIIYLRLAGEPQGNHQMSKVTPEMSAEKLTVGKYFTQEITETTWYKWNSILHKLWLPSEQSKSLTNVWSLRTLFQHKIRQK